MTAAAPPRGRPQYAALRDEIATSASGGRKTSSHRTPPLLPFSPCGSPPAELCKEKPSLRVPSGTGASRGAAATRATLQVAISQLADQCSDARPEKLLRPTVIDRAPWEIIPDKLTVYRVDFLLRRGARGDYPYELELRSSRAGCPYAGRAVPPGTRYGPDGRENSLCPRAWGNHSR